MIKLYCAKKDDDNRSQINTHKKENDEHINYKLDGQ